jgi:hypothetical protein
MLFDGAVFQEAHPAGSRWGLPKTCWAWVAIGIQVAVLVPLLVIRYNRGGRVGLRLWRRT